MNDRVVVIGGGIGGLVAALRARQRGAEVCLVEARDQLGGLASEVVADGSTFDGGPYILLDRVRLGWALDQVGIDLAGLDLVQLDPAYQVVDAAGATVTVHTNLGETAAGMDLIAPGSGDRYRRFVGSATTALERMAPTLAAPYSPIHFMRSGGWRATPWVLGSLAQHLRRYRIEGLPRQAISIWTLIAGADPRVAPGPMALVPGLIHRDGAVRPAGGVHRLVRRIVREVDASGVEVRLGTPVKRIDHRLGRVSGVTLDDGETLEAPTVISDVGGARALLDLTDLAPPAHLKARLRGRLQSPGVTAYLRLRGTSKCEIRFRVDGDPPAARAVIHPQETDAAGWSPGRLIAPLSHAEAQRLGTNGQRELLDRYVDEAWWRDGLEVETVTTRLVSDWGSTFRLRDNAMNLAMTRSHMLSGRLPHRMRHLPGLYLTGSWTHPGQWISFCSVSGILAADAAVDGAEATRG